MNIFASNLLAKREEKRYTQAYMAMQCGMSQPNYSDIERGKTSPSIRQLKRFAEVLDASIDELISERPVGSIDFANPVNSFNKQHFTESDKDIYIKILENRLRVLLLEKESHKQLS
ncbi:helix-turn-helix domain-containing protein [Dyadobacter arcticus]|uniref:Transcriptional regulator with XRE-family HTH domain n=1 Tax=Dyadobacter arcticus TaxID=1078754 RepID=A0ABX0ULW2_9BACT|nr:helix-turn-helix transcriptional regulator [Dyadobacter arcticus]NIJ53084.1 transcriptional regulator with XRE-family HTH domain [Dyadobacter arcticus]